MLGIGRRGADYIAGKYYMSLRTCSARKEWSSGNLVSNYLKSLLSGLGKKGSHPIKLI